MSAGESLCAHHCGHFLDAHAEPKRADGLERHKVPLRSLGVVDDGPHLRAFLQAITEPRLAARWSATTVQLRPVGALKPWSTKGNGSLGTMP